MPKQEEHDPMTVVSNTDRLAKLKSRATDQLTSAKVDCAEAEDKVLRAESTEKVTGQSLDECTTALDNITAKARTLNPADDDQIRWVGNERAYAEVRKLALQGQLERDRAQTATARTDLDTARVKLSQVQKEHDAAREKLDRALADAEEARLVAAGDPGALREKAAREKREAIYNEHLRTVRAGGSFAPGGPCEASVEAQKIHLRLANKEASPALAPNDHGWGSSSFERGRYSSPVGARAGRSEQGGTSPQWDPYANEET